MKELTCNKMSGPEDCTVAISGETSEEMIGKGWAHLQESHSELAESIQNNPKEVNEKWMAEFHENFAALPEKEA